MRICLVWNSTTRLADSSIRYERYVRGFRGLGHEVTVVTARGRETDFPEEAYCVPSLDDLLKPALWSDLRPEVVLLPTWLGMSSLLAAMRPYVGHVIALTDSDGRSGVRVFPRQILVRMLAMQPRAWGRVRAAGWWLRQYL